ncbi:MAG: DNA topoisomerase VI subunit B [Planctomycetota bacterium]
MSTKAAPQRETAETLAKKQKQISISEFFAKNRHLLGFDNPRKALLTAIKEMVDNSLDACEDMGMPPDIFVGIDPGERENRFRITVRDNGPGILKKQVPSVFGKLLYGSKFHGYRQQRGQQGIGVSAAGLYAMLTTGKPVEVITKTGPRKKAYRCELRIDTQHNRPDTLGEKELDWDEVRHGTEVVMELEGTYQRGRHSVDSYLEQTAITNPHAQITYRTPDGEERVFERATTEMPRPTHAIKPHPYGVELGVLMRMIKETSSKHLGEFFQNEFSRVGAKVAAEICETAKADPKSNPHRLGRASIDELYHAIQKVKISAPPTDCISPIGEELLLKSLQKEVEADFYHTVTRSPAVYRGMPFCIEAGLAYGGNIPGDDPARLLRFANRVPLLYQQSGCAITKATIETSWRNYNLQQSRGALPVGPLIIVVHMASVWVPFTSESKEAVASYPEIMKEIKLALQDCGRKLGTFIRKRRREADEEKKRSYIQKYIPQIGIALQDILGLNDKNRDDTCENLKTVLERSRKM